MTETRLEADASNNIDESQRFFNILCEIGRLRAENEDLKKQVQRLWWMLEERD